MVRRSKVGRHPEPRGGIPRAPLAATEIWFRAAEAEQGWHGEQCAGATREGSCTEPALSTQGYGSQAQCQCTLRWEQTSQGLCRVCFGQDELLCPRERAQRDKGE